MGSKVRLDVLLVEDIVDSGYTIASVLELLRTHFDVVLVDSPPCPAFVETVLVAADSS